MKKPLFFFLLFVPLLSIIGDDLISKVEELGFAGKYQKAFDALSLEYSKNPNVNPAVNWHLAMMAFELAGQSRRSSERVNFYEKGIEVTLPLMEKRAGTKRDQAEIIHWYAVNYASRLKELGLFGGPESLKIVPTIFSLMDRCIDIMPEYAGAYFFKAKLIGEVPFFLGGDKSQMDAYYAKAFYYAQEHELMILLVESAEGYLKRNWSVLKKQEKLKNDQTITADYLALSDNEYGLKLLTKALGHYRLLEKKSYRDDVLYEKAKSLIKKTGVND